MYIRFEEEKFSTKPECNGGYSGIYAYKESVDHYSIALVDCASNSHDIKYYFIEVSFFILNNCLFRYKVFSDHTDYQFLNKLVKNKVKFETNVATPGLLQLCLNMISLNKILEAAFKCGQHDGYSKCQENLQKVLTGDFTDVDSNE